MEDRIIGTWWLVATTKGNRYIGRADKVIKDKRGFLLTGNKECPWIGLDDNRAGILNGEKVNKDSFKHINFPEVTYETSPIEIEIGKSGRVYTYDP